MHNYQQRNIFFCISYKGVESKFMPITILIFTGIFLDYFFTDCSVKSFLFSQVHMNIGLS